MKMKGKMKRIGAVILAFVLVATMSQWPAMVKAAGSEGVVTITNPGFESDLSNGWSIADSMLIGNVGEMSQESDMVWTGDYSAKLHAGNRGDYQLIEWIKLTSDSYELKRGKTYTFGGYVALQTGDQPSAAQQIYAQLVDADGNAISGTSTNVVAPATGLQGWTKIMATYTPDTTQSVKIQFYYSGTNGEKLDNSWVAYVDNVFCSLENADFELTNGAGLPEAWESEDVTIATSTTTQNGTQSMHLQKDNLNETSFVYGTALYAIDKADVTSDFEVEWGMYQSSKDSDSFVRVDATFYDENYQVIESFAGTRSMLSRESSYCDYTKVSTVMTVPYEAKYISYDVVLSSGKSDVLVDNIFCNVATEIERTPDSSVTGWSAQEIWYPENEKEDGVWQFRYFRTKVTLPSAIVGTELWLQVVADDSFSVVIGDNFVWNALYVNGEPYYNVAAKTIKNSKTVLTYIIPVSDLNGAEDLLIATRVLNCNSYAGLVIQGFAILNQGSNFNYETVIETTASNTVTSKLGCTEPMADDNYNEFATWREPDEDADWYAVNYDDSQWILAEERGIPPYGEMGDVPFDWKHSDGFFIYDSGEDGNGRDVSVTAGEKVEVVVPGAYAALYGADVYTNGKPETPTKVQALLYRASEYADKSNATALDVIATVDVDITWVPDQTGSTFTISVPDYLPADTYKVILQQVRFANGANQDNVLANLTVKAADKPMATSKVTTENGAVRLKVNDETVSPVMYLRPSETAYYNYGTMSAFENTGIELYSTYNGFLDGADGAPIWTAKDTIDYDAFDLEIYRTLDLNPNAMVMVNMNMDAPDWWLDQNEDQKIKLADGSTLNEVSFASTKYREDASKVVKQLVEHMTNASYKHRIVGVKLTGGQTYEWMNFTQSDDGYVYGIDYSEPMKEAFGGTLPTIDERRSGNNGVLLNASNQSAVITYNKALSQCITDSLLTYAKAVKVVNEDWVVGAYNGYLWNEGSAAGIGAAHTTIEQLLDSSYIDFISSPINYSERISGYGTGYMALSESVAAHGKLYILEQDNRTLYGRVYSNADAEGATYSVKESMQQLVRDTATDLVKGNGLWYFDMQGGWYDHDKIEACIKELKTEYDYSIGMDMSTNSQVAVFVGSETYHYLADDTLDNDAETNDSYKLMGQLYNAQRLELSKMGTSYDTYMIEDLTSQTVTTDWSQYKFSIILSPFELTEAERTAIANKLQKNGNYVLWIYLPGVSDGTGMNAENIQNVTGMTVTMNTEETTLAAKINSDSFGVEGDTYGAAYTYEAPYVVIGADGVTQLATYTNGKGIAAAMKDCGTYTSVYSAVPNVPADALRDLCVAAGVHMYTEDKDTVVETNASYVTVHSQVAGEKIVTLPENEWGYKVYDVLNGTNVTVTDCSFTATLSNAGDTGLYRITPLEAVEIANKDWNGVLIQNGNFADWTGESPAGYALLGEATLKRSIDIEKGYIATLDGKADYQEFEYVVNVEAGKRYELSLCSKSTGTAGKVCQILGEDWTQICSGAEVWMTADTNGAWENITYTFDATVSEKIYLRWTMFGGEENSWSLTNLRLQVVGDDDLILNGTFTDVDANSSTGYLGWAMGSDSYTGQGENIVKNSGMDTFLDAGFPGYFRLADWEARLDFITMEYAQGADGSENSAVKMISGDGTQVGGVTKYKSQFIWDWQSISLSENTDYTLTFTGKAEKSSAIMFVMIVPSSVTDLDETQKIAKAEIAAGANAGTWQTASVTFNSGELTSANVMIVCYDTENELGGDIYYVDEVTLCQSNVSVQNTPTITEISDENIEGIQFGGGHFCYLGAWTTAQTVANATYVLKMNTAMSGTGTVNMSFLNTSNWMSDYNFTVQTNEDVTAQRVLIPFTNSAVYEMRTTLLNADKNSLFSLGNVSLKLNRGDFDENNGGYPDVDDFTAMRKVLIGSDEATENAKTFAEMNADGKVDVRDLVRMKLYGARMK